MLFSWYILLERETFKFISIESEFRLVIDWEDRVRVYYIPIHNLLYHIKV
jgi:hypothetical protein